LERSFQRATLGAKQSSYEKVTAETIKVKFHDQLTSKGNNTLLRSLFEAQEQYIEIL